MPDTQVTPGTTFQFLLNQNAPAAMAWVRGGTEFPRISGLVKFYRTSYGGILVEAEFFNLPGYNMPGSSGFFAMHIHEGGDCSHDFIHVGEHLGAPGSPHPYHTGDLLPLLANQGYAWSAFYDKRFTIEDILGRSVVIHHHSDDFHTQPSGNPGAAIACGRIMRM